MRLLVKVLLLVACVLGWVGIVNAPAYADCVGGAEAEFDDLLGRVVTSVRCPGSSSSSPSGGAGGTRVCHSPMGLVIPCRTAAGSWNGERTCYSMVSPDQAAIVRPPLAGDWTLMQCTRLSGAVGYYLVNPTEPPPPDPRVLAQTAVSRMNLEAVRIGSMPSITERSPGAMGVVGFNVWLWVDQASASSFGPITRSASAGGYTVTATARVVEVVWDMGNGESVSCQEGTAFRGRELRPEQVSPDCGYTYVADGDYVVSATSRWEVVWSGIGQSGVMEMELVSSGQLTIAEVQVLNVPVTQN